MTFKELKFRDVSDTHGEGGKQALVGFENNYDISVVKHKFSHGSDKGLYEIGCFFNDRMVDPADWGDTVKGWLNESDVEHWLNYVERL
ncbi:hypothetical protein CMI37_39415 [Candidatus Pacearchaeota archaeon]|nr:hypothetical protein [Candidatus Pacearchaeota archaeon]|tara:strand:- start:2288 stop:2551 length:264 start_codon:yes stop_codon:yes gene_type:complete